MFSAFRSDAASLCRTALIGLATLSSLACSNDVSAANDGGGTAKNEQEWVGWLIDTDCVGANPVSHTQSCNLMPTCIDSGFGIYVLSPGKDYKSYAATDWIPFDISSQALAKQLNWVLSEPENKNAHLAKYVDKVPTIRVTGHLVPAENIVNDPDWDNDPKTVVTLATMGDWAEAIHLHSIEFHNMRGVSNYEVSAPEEVMLTESTPGN